MADRNHEAPGAAAPVRAPLWTVRTAEELAREWRETPLDVVVAGLGPLSLPQGWLETSGLHESHGEDAPGMRSLDGASYALAVPLSRAAQSQAEGGLWTIPLLITGATSKDFNWEFFASDHLGTT